MDPIRVRPTTIADLPYVASLARKEAENIGFLPYVAYERILAGERPDWRFWLAEVNADPVGFLFASPGAAGASLRVVQLAIQHDARLREYGSSLLKEAEAYAHSCQRQGVTASVATDIAAGSFWDALGYDVTGIVPGGKRRTRYLERRYKRLPGGLFDG